MPCGLTNEEWKWHGQINALCLIEVYQNYLHDSDGARAKELSRVGVIKNGGNSFWGLRWPHELHTFDKVAKSGRNCEK